MRGWHHHGSDMPTSPGAILQHTDQFFYTFLYTTIVAVKIQAFLALLFSSPLVLLSNLDLLGFCFRSFIFVPPH